VPALVRSAIPTVAVCERRGDTVSVTVGTVVVDNGELRAIAV
jgi:hypothetical protein